MDARSTVSLIAGAWIHATFGLALYVGTEQTKFSDRSLSPGPEVAVELEPETTRESDAPQQPARSAPKGRAALEPGAGRSVSHYVHSTPKKPTEAHMETPPAPQEELPFSGVLRRPDSPDESTLERTSAAAEPKARGLADGTRGSDVGGLRAKLAEQDHAGGGLYIGKYVLTGGPPIETINRILQENQATFQRCNANGSSATVSVHTSFRITAQGDAVIYGTDLGEGYLSRDAIDCLERAIARLRFPGLEREIRMRQRFAFAPTCVQCGMAHVEWIRD